MITRTTRYLEHVEEGFPPAAEGGDIGHTIDKVPYTYHTNDLVPHTDANTHAQRRMTRYLEHVDEGFLLATGGRRVLLCTHPRTWCRTQITRMTWCRIQMLIRTTTGV
jgi:hypothetical protein